MPLHPSYKPDGALEARGIRTGDPVRASIDEDTIPTAVWYITVLCQLALEQPGLKTKTSTHYWSELSA
jgi:hypothetical protein